MPKLPEVPAGMRLFLWLGEYSVSEWVTPIVASDEDAACKIAITERSKFESGPDALEKARARFEGSDRIVDITDMTEPL